MKKTRVVVTLLIAFDLILCLVFYLILPEPIKSIVNAVIEVPLCNSRIANKLGTESDRWRSHIIESLEPGMARNEVEETLHQIAPVAILDTSVDGSGGTYVSMRVEVCNNPFGVLILDVHYSKDEKLIDAIDAWAD